MNVRGKTITADALHCQRDTCAMITQQGGDYVIGLKGNQKSLLEDVELYFRCIDGKECVEEFSTLEKNGGRVEKRICRKLKDIAWLQERHDWPGLKAVFQVERTIRANRKITTETSYYIASTDASAKRLLCIAREHWNIESMHWFLDVVFSEDASRFLSENAHLCLNAFRKYALAMQKKYVSTLPKKSSVKRHLVDCLLNDQILLKVISNTRIF